MKQVVRISNMKQFMISGECLHDSLYFIMINFIMNFLFTVDGQTLTTSHCAIRSLSSFQEGIQVICTSVQVY